MNSIFPKILGVFTGWTGGGPWRSKSVLAALAAVVVGLGFWFSDIKKIPPQTQTNTAATNASEITPANTAAAPAGTHWNWRKPFPIYVRLCASYVAGFCIGWLFRNLIRLVLVIGALVVALFALGKYAGCNLAPAEEQVKRSGEWAQHEATAAKDYLMHLLPSATGGAVGTFLGFRRRGKAATPKPAG